MKKYLLSAGLLFFFIIACQQSISPSNNAASDYRTIKSLLFEQDRCSDALAEIEKALSQNINDSLLLYLRGMANVNVKEYDKAMTDFSAAMRIAPENPLPLNGIGNIFYLKYDDILAEKFWAHGLTLAKKPSERAMFLGNMALLAINGKKYSEALKLLDEAHRLSPDGRYTNLTGRVYASMKNFQKAKEIWLASLSDSSLPWAQFNFKHNTCYRLAELYLSENNYKDALKFSELALMMSPANTDYQRLYVQLKQKVK